MDAIILAAHHKTLKALTLATTRRLDTDMHSRKGRVASTTKEGRLTRKQETVVNDQETKKCAHIPCLCDVPIGQTYCGDACRDAGSEDVEIACQCDHLRCPLTAQ